VWILIAGVAGKLGWLSIGLLQLRRYRKRAIPLSPLPDSVREARRLTQADALFGISESISGPATLGHIDPIVLLPESFLSLDEESQRSIACHELLHVQRRDWLVTVVEEVVGALLWFNPGVWWMLAQARLSREQLVDSEVVRIAAREPYIEALLSMAVISRRRWALPAASFFTQGHLIHRMRLLLATPNRSWLRLCVCYVSVTLLLASSVWGVISSFPLVSHSLVVLGGQPQAQQITVRATDPPGHVVPRLRPPENFTIAVPPPTGPDRDVLYFVHRSVLSDGTPLVPLPPLPPSPSFASPPFGYMAARGIRMVRPGDTATSEEIQSIKEAFGERVEVEIDQAENGVIQRVRFTSRRLSDEADNVRPLVAPVATEPAAPGNRVD
jgi:hypothetical protein